MERYPPEAIEGDLAYWAGIVPGDTSETLWTGYHTFDELPKVIDPPNGYVHNTNDPPWNAGWPTQLDPDKYPPYTAPRNISFRAERSFVFSTRTKADLRPVRRQQALHPFRNG